MGFGVSLPGSDSEPRVKVATFQGCPQVLKTEHHEERLDQEARAPGWSPNTGFTVAKTSPLLRPE